METSIPSSLLQRPTMLQNDDFGGRQFLYPSLYVDIAGDYNGDGAVGAEDYELWQANFGQRGIGLAADGNGDNAVNAADFVLWRKQTVLATMPEHTGSGHSVPEQPGIVIAFALYGWATACYCTGARPSRKPSSAST
jgi:hypothetical protein